MANAQRLRRAIDATARHAPSSQAAALTSSHPPCPRLCSAQLPFQPPHLAMPVAPFFQQTPQWQPQPPTRQQQHQMHAQTHSQHTTHTQHARMPQPPQHAPSQPQLSSSPHDWLEMPRTSTFKSSFVASPQPPSSAQAQAQQLWMTQHAETHQRKSFELTGAQSARLQSTHVEGIFRVTQPLYNQTAAPSLAASTPLPYLTSRAFTSTARLDTNAAFARSVPLPASASITPRLVSAHGSLYPTHSFRRSCELHPLNPTERATPRILALVSGRSNPNHFAAPLADDVFQRDENQLRRCFPARNQCGPTRFRENLMRCAVETD